MRSSSLVSLLTMVACRGVLSRMDSPKAVPMPRVQIVTASCVQTQTEVKRTCMSMNKNMCRAEDIQTRLLKTLSYSEFSVSLNHRSQTRLNKVSLSVLYSASAPDTLNPRMLCLYFSMTISTGPINSHCCVDDSHSYLISTFQKVKRKGSKQELMGRWEAKHLYL